MIYLINTKTKEHIDATALGDSRYEQFARSPGWVVQMADPAGWIEWHGGECPLPDGHLCDVRHRDGDECAMETHLPRPIRSEEDRITEELERIMYKPAMTREMAARIYEAIRDGKVPGVKLEDT